MHGRFEYKNMGGSSYGSVGRAVVLALGALSVVSCGNSASNPVAHSGAGGMSGSGTASASGTSARGGTSGGGTAGAGVAANSATAGTIGASGAGASGGSAGLSLGDSPTEVCIAYVVAQCLRRVECADRPDTAEYCLTTAAGCPDTVFADGSTRTVAGTKACTAEFATFSCEQMQTGFLPACATKGTRTPGQACVSNIQCASGRCDLSEAACGQCVSLAELAAPCSKNDGVNCKPGLFCKQSTALCTAYPETSAAHPLFTEGGGCAAETGCNGDLYCGRDLLCTKYPTLGMSCELTGDCRGDSYCAMTDRSCTALPGPGQPCGGDTGRCSRDAVCSFTDATSATCLALPSVGQPCLSVLAFDLSTKEKACAEGSFCADTSVCAAPGPAAARCLADGQCQAGLSCACADGSSTCSARLCTKIGLANAPCGVPGATCHAGFSCTAGSCQPRATQGLLDACPVN